jgi:hypothetical protein
LHQKTTNAIALKIKTRQKNSVFSDFFVTTLDNKNFLQNLTLLCTQLDGSLIASEVICPLIGHWRIRFVTNQFSSFAFTDLDFAELNLEFGFQDFTSSDFLFYIRKRST